MKMEKFYLDKNGKPKLEKVPCFDCPYCNFNAFGDKAKIEIDNHMKQYHPDKLGKLQRFIDRIKMSEFYSWKLPQYFCPIWCECISIRFLLLSIMPTFILSLLPIYPVEIRAYLSVGWFIGFNIVGWINAIRLGMFESHV